MKGVLRNLYTGVDADTAVTLLRNKVAETDMAIVLPVDKVLLKRLYQHISTLAGASPLKFFFVLPEGSAWKKAAVNEAGRFFFLSNYLYGEGAAPMLVVNGKVDAETLPAFGQWCNGQGLSGPHVQEARSFSKGLQERDLICVAGGQRESYFGHLQSVPLKWALHPAIIEVSGEDDYSTLKEQLRQFKESLMKGSPEAYTALQTIAVLEEERRQNKELLRFLQQEVQNLKVYNDQLRDSNETERILKFYHAQYEVLPLWYKRFGHVIKILMGKRKISFTFKKGDR